ncbi:MAG: YncE family protein [Candidatus Solibacter usitatus]|nr:YncE family protein [Candidatus Solibacter usitatus]
MQLDASRRTFLAGAGLTILGCGRRARPGFAGFAFIANEEGSAVAAVDLTAFAVIRHIRLDAAPTELINHNARKTIYALTPTTGGVHEIATASMLRARSTGVGGKVVGVRHSRLKDAIYAIVSTPRQLVEIELDSMRVTRRIPLPATPVDMDLAPHQPLALISMGAEGAAVVNLASGAVERVPTGFPAGTVRFRQNGLQWIAAHRERKMLSFFDTATSRLVVRVPLAMHPENFCFKADGGQLFVTGAGMDAVAIVYPYSTEVAETVLAGHGPAAMAVSHDVRGTAELLYVTNPQSGQVTILSIDSRKVITTAPAGGEPSFIALTPDNQCALVLNRRSGDVSVLMTSVARRNKNTPSLFTMIPVGSKPVCAVVQAV